MGGLRLLRKNFDVSSGGRLYFFGRRGGYFYFNASYPWRYLVINAFLFFSLHKMSLIKLYKMFLEYHYSRIIWLIMPYNFMTPLPPISCYYLSWLISFVCSGNRSTHLQRHGELQIAYDGLARGNPYHNWYPSCSVRPNSEQLLFAWKGSCSF